MNCVLPQWRHASRPAPGAEAGWGRGTRSVAGATEAAARCALTCSDPGQACIELSGAADVLAGMGATSDTARVRALLRAVDPTRPRRPPGRPALRGVLSPREWEVAELAGRGLTNREIAVTLHLSPRTVEQHVAHAIRKLAVPSRQGLASALDQVPLP